MCLLYEDSITINKKIKLVGKPDGTKPNGRPRRRCEDNIKMDLMEIEWEGVEWINLAQDRDR
jgi:hypothetical protein